MRQIDINNIEYLVVHCADTYASMDIGAEEIRHWHVVDNGWDDIGYHKIIRRDGSVEDGRSQSYAGAHAAAFNGKSYAVCLIGGKGDDDGAEDNFTVEQKEALHSVISSWKVTCPDAEVLGHCYLPDVSKACPSFDVKAWWASVDV